MYQAETGFMQSDGTDLSIIATAFDPRVVVHEPDSLPYAGDWRGHTGLARLFRRMHSAWSTMDVQDMQAAIKDDTLFMKGTLVATARQTGQTVNQPFAELLKLKGGMVTEGTPFYYDTAVINTVLDHTPDKTIEDSGIRYDIFESPIGTLTVATDGAFITALHIEGDRYFTTPPASWQRDTFNALLQQTKEQLAEYFAGTRQQFELPLKTDGTPFQRAVWQALTAIPFGKTATYAQLAASIGKPEAVRAAGTAVGSNPICILIPCHRAMASDGSLGGYVAGLERKQALLELEQTKS
jgi:methylated-DNA-[protein]-cysteine S-methyltransferase